MKQLKKVIGVLDLNIDNIYILNSLRERFKNDDIIYINDMSIENIDEMDINDINKSVNNIITYLMSKKIDILVVASDSIVEYCEELLSSLSVPVVNIVEESINYTNEIYEHKNFGFLSTTSMIEANIYQKNLKYNHLYSMVGDDLKELIKKHLVKTTESFQEVKNIIASVFKKDLDVIIPSLINYLTVTTEINEFLKDVDIIPLDKLICDSVQNKLYKLEPLAVKGKGVTYICEKEKLDYNQLNRLLKIKYKIINLNE